MNDGRVISDSQLMLGEGGRLVHFDVEVTPGIHKVVVAQAATATSGKSLIADFQSRFRSGDELNPIVKLQKDFISDGSLASISNPNRDGQRILALHHKAAGAELFRVSLDLGKTWSKWSPYASSTEMPVHASGKSLDVWVQYWADGSAAYFSRTTVSL